MREQRASAPLNTKRMWNLPKSVWVKTALSDLLYSVIPISTRLDETSIFLNGTFKLCENGDLTVSLEISETLEIIGSEGLNASTQTKQSPQAKAGS